MDLVRLATIGSVDDGKSTLIGRLLFDTKNVKSDHVTAVEIASERRGSGFLDLALLTDSLRSEREQGITIDVAHRYFSTATRSFIIADAPGHIQYTRNMVTGASTADIALILVDASQGLLTQTKRHAFIASLLGVSHLVLCVNKMDLVGYEESVYQEVVESFRSFASKLTIKDIRFIPISALHGDNVAWRSAAMPWYGGLPLIQVLEEIHVGSDANLIDCRLPVQSIINPRRVGETGFRGYAGTVAGGIFKPGDYVVALPSGFGSTISSISGPDGSIDEATPGTPVVLEMEDHLDIGRGDMLCREHNRPHVGQDLDAMLCWLTPARELRPGATFAIKHTTRWARVLTRDLLYRLDVDTLHREESDSLGMNDVGRVILRSTLPLFYDPYHRNRTTGSFILVDEATNATVGAGMINGPA